MTQSIEDFIQNLPVNTPVPLMSKDCLDPLESLRKFMEPSNMTPVGGMIDGHLMSLQDTMTEMYFRINAMLLAEPYAISMARIAQVLVAGTYDDDDDAMKRLRDVAGNLGSQHQSLMSNIQERGVGYITEIMEHTTKMSETKAEKPTPKKKKKKKKKG